MKNVIKGRLQLGLRKIQMNSMNDSSIIPGEQFNDKPSYSILPFKEPATGLRLGFLPRQSHLLDFSFTSPFHPFITMRLLFQKMGCRSEVPQLSISAKQLAASRLRLQVQNRWVTYHIFIYWFDWQTRHPSRYNDLHKPT